MTDLAPDKIPEQVQAPPRRRLPVGSIIAYALILGLLGMLGWRLVKVNSGQVDSGMAPDFTITSFEGDLKAKRSP